MQISRAMSARVVTAATLCFAGLSANAQQSELASCLDRNPAGSYECAYRPHIVPPWSIWIAGPVQATPNLLTEDAVKENYGANLAANCPTCCDPGTLVGESGWTESVDVFRWGPQWPRWYNKTLTYVASQRGSDGQCLPPFSFNAWMAKSRAVACENGWAKVQVAVDVTLCRRPQRNSECRFGNPISLPAGTKVFTETDYRSANPRGLAFVRDYRGDGFSYPDSNMDDLWSRGFGRSWVHNYDGTLYVTAQSIWVSWGQSPPQYFSLPVSSSYPVALAPIRRAQKVKLTQVASGTYVYTTEKNELVVFQVSGAGLAKPTAVKNASGWGVNIAYSALGPETLTETGGRSVRIVYNLNGRIVSIVDPAGASIAYSYKAPLTDGTTHVYEGFEYTSLEQITYQDLSSRKFVSASLLYGGVGSTDYDVNRVSNVVDELGVVYETITYQPYGGPVKSTELAGGVEKHTLSNQTVTDPLGASRYLAFNGSAADNLITSQSQPAGSGCGASQRSYTYDSTTANPSSSTDYRGNLVCYAYDDGTRNVELARIEGLATYASCANYTATGATLPAGTRKVSTQWHPDWRLASKVAEPSRITSYVYNGQPDPFAGGALASCAPASALLPDGKPIAVLCRQVEQATTDANGSLGFSATLDSTVANREQKWTYNQWGQVLSHDGPRTDVADITTYSYYSDTSFTGVGAAAVGHTIGDLQSVTNAAGKVTQYTKYDKHGQLLESVDPNGVVSTNSYDLRQRLLSTSVGGQTTSYTYDLAGQLKRVTRPDASWIGFDYDPAHRQTAVYDNLGNRIEYTLDNAGNRTAESVKDTSGALRRQLARSIDALGRVQQVTGAQ